VVKKVTSPRTARLHQGVFRWKLLLERKLRNL
jgi:hypothetical protein